MSHYHPRALSWAVTGTFFHQSAFYSWVMLAGSVSHLQASPRLCPSVRWLDTQTERSLQPRQWCPWRGEWQPGLAQLVVLGVNKEHFHEGVVKWYFDCGILSQCVYTLLASNLEICWVTTSQLVRLSHDVANGELSTKVSEWNMDLYILKQKKIKLNWAQLKRNIPFTSSFPSHCFVPYSLMILQV